MTLTATQSRVADLKAAVLKAMESRLSEILSDHLSQPKCYRYQWPELVQRATNYQQSWSPRALLQLDPNDDRFRQTGRIIRELREAGVVSTIQRTSTDIRVRWVTLLRPPQSLQDIVAKVEADRDRIVDERKAAHQASIARAKRAERHEELHRNLHYPFVRLCERVSHRSLFWHSGEFTRHDVYLAELCRDYSGDSFAERLVSLLRDVAVDNEQMIESQTRCDIEAMLAAVGSVISAP